MSNLNIYDLYLSKRPAVTKLFKSTTVNRPVDTRLVGMGAHGTAPSLANYSNVMQFSLAFLS